VGTHAQYQHIAEQLQGYAHQSRRPAIGDHLLHMTKAVQQMVPWGGEVTATGQHAILALAQRIASEENAIEGVCA
jgi:hypothetical protein